MNDLPEFYLAPWDTPRPTRFRPRAEAVAVVDGEEFLLRSENGLLFARLARRNEPQWTFALLMSPELEAERALWPLWFEEKWTLEEFARFVLFRYDGSFTRDFPFFFGLDGRGWMRESWNRDDCHFTHSLTPTLVRWGDENVLCAEAEKVFHRDVWEWLEAQPRPVKTEKSQEKEPSFLCGSGEELARLTRLICALEPALEKLRTYFFYSAESQFHRAAVHDIYHYAHLQVDENGNYAYQHQAPEVLLSRRFFILTDLALDHNTPVGYYWEYHDMNTGRAADSPYNEWFKVEMEPPNKLQKAEARAELREWLHGKVSDTQIEAILNDDTPADLPVGTRW